MNTLTNRAIPLRARTTICIATLCCAFLHCTTSAQSGNAPPISNQPSQESGQAADPVADTRVLPQAADRAPLAVIGGDLLIQLQARNQNPNDWPTECTLTTDDGRQLNGAVLWVTPGTDRDTRHWTLDPRMAAVDAQPIFAADQGTHFAPVPYLAVSLPPDVSGPLILGGQVIRPDYFPRPQQPPAGEPRIGAWPDIRNPRPDRPDMRSPFEYWRTVLIARRDGMEPPDLTHLSPREAIVARHFAQLWDVALTQLAADDPAVADECIELLTRRCRDESTGQRVAAWIAAPDRTSRLLTRLLDRSISPRDRVDEARSWVQDQPKLLFWSVSSDREHVELAVLNRGRRSVSARLTWDGLPVNDNTRDNNAGDDDNTHVVRFRAGQCQRFRLVRPTITRPRMIGQDVPTVVPLTTLRIVTDEQTFGVAFSLIEGTAQPPALSIPACNPLLTLAAVEATSQRVVSSNRNTAVQIRRRNKRWELFIECMRPSNVTGIRTRLDDLTPGTDITQPVGVEAVVVRIVAPESMRAAVESTTRRPADPLTLVIAEQGWWNRVAGPPAELPQVFRRSWSDRWYARVVLPDTWLPDAIEIQPLEISVTRTHGDGTGIEMFPGRAPSWAMDDTEIFAHINLAEWLDQPGKAIIR